MTREGMLSTEEKSESCLTIELQPHTSTAMLIHKHDITLIQWSIMWDSGIIPLVMSLLYYMLLGNDRGSSKQYYKLNRMLSNRNFKEIYYFDYDEYMRR